MPSRTSTRSLNEKASLAGIYSPKMPVGTGLCGGVAALHAGIGLLLCGPVRFGQHGHN